MKEEKMSTQLMVSDVDSSGERLPLKGLRKVTILYVFSLLLLLQMANIKKKNNLSDWPEKTVKCQAVIKEQTCFLLKRYQQKEKPNLSASERKSRISSCAVLHTSKTHALYKAYTIISDSNL